MKMPLSLKLCPIHRNSPLLDGRTLPSASQVVSESRFGIDGSTILILILITYLSPERMTCCYGMGTKSLASDGLRFLPSFSTLHDLKIISRTVGIVLVSRNSFPMSLGLMRTMAGMPKTRRIHRSRKRNLLLSKKKTPRRSLPCRILLSNSGDHINSGWELLLLCEESEQNIDRTRLAFKGAAAY